MPVDDFTDDHDFGSDRADTVGPGRGAWFSGHLPGRFDYPRLHKAPRPLGTLAADATGRICQTARRAMASARKEAERTGRVEPLNLPQYRSQARAMPRGFGSACRGFDSCRSTIVLSR